jgi:hypothetical protein
MYPECNTLSTFSVNKREFPANCAVETITVVSGNFVPQKREKQIDYRHTTLLLRKCACSLANEIINTSFIPAPEVDGYTSAPRREHDHSAGEK